MASYEREYRRYLNDKRDIEAQSGEKFKKALGFLALGGTVVGAAYGAHKLGATSFLVEKYIGAASSTRYIAKTTGALEETVKESLQRTTFIDMFSNRFLKEINTNLQSKVSQFDSHAPTHLEKMMQQRSTAKRELYSSVVSHFKFKDIIKDIDDLDAGEQGDIIKRALASVKDWELRNKPEDKIRNIFYEGNITDNDFFNEVLSIVKKQNAKYADITKQGKTPSGLKNITGAGIKRTAGEVTPEEEKTIKDVYKELLKHVDQEFYRRLEYASNPAIEKDSFFNSVLEGTKYRKATLKDAVEQKAIISKDGTDMTLHYSRMMKNKPELGELVLDSGLFIDKSTNDFVDIRHVGENLQRRLKYFSNDFEIPFVKLNPLRLLHMQSIQMAKDAPFFKTFTRGAYDPILSGGREPLTGDYFVAGDKVFDIATREMVKDNVYLASAKYGVIPKALYTMAGYERESVTEIRKKAGWLRNTFDFGMQEYEDEFSKLYKAITKGSNPDWAVNRAQPMLNAAYIKKSGIELSDIHVLPNDMINSYKVIYNMLSTDTGVLTTDAMQNLLRKEIVSGSKKMSLAEFYQINPDIVTSNLDEGVYSLGKAILDSIKNKENTIGITNYSPAYETMQRLVTKIGRDKSVADEFRIVSHEKLPFTDGLFAFEAGESSRAVNKTEDLLKSIQMDMVWRIEKHSATKQTDLQFITELTESMMIKDKSTVENMFLLNRMLGDRQQLFKSFMVEQDLESVINASAEVVSRLGGPDQWALSAITSKMKKAYPVFGPGPGMSPPGYLSNDFMIMNKVVNPIKVVNEVINSGGSFSEIAKAITESTFGQLGIDFGFGFRAGRKNMDKITTATVASFFGVHRLEQAIGRLGLGLSSKSMGSTQDLYLNLIGRRMLLPIMAANYAGYANHLVQSITGIDIKDSSLEANVRSRIGIANFKEAFGINDVFRQFGELIPGGDQIKEFAPIKIFDTLTMGAFSDARSGQELTEYFYEGYDPIRKGRYWPAGSSTAWSGQKIQYWKPTSFRLSKTDYLMTKEMYGSRGEYYANQWFPTLSNPLGPIKSVILDPHHWYYKHYQDRPYPSSGGADIIESLPIIGAPSVALMDLTGITRIRERPGLANAHRDYLRAINEDIQKADAGLYVSPGGGTKIVEPRVVYEDSGGNVPISVYGDSEESYSETVSQNAATYGKGNGMGYGASMSDLTDINRRTMAAVKFDPQSIYKNLVDIAELSAISGPTSISHRAGETYYSLTEMAGIYGFSFFSALGHENEPSPALAQSTYMSSFSRRFWDTELGGFGGMVSEIYRRFIPNSKYRRKDYNPFKNQMPEWLPMNFQFGDPFAQIPVGEARLPGEAYERLNKLHPDQFGEYGAIDRFKILADVAPYSDEYSFWLGIVRSMDLTDKGKAEVNAARKRAASVKKSQRFYPYKFKYSDEIDHEKVRVTKVIDANTFLTNEYPNNPIRLAGMSIRESDPDSEEAIALVSQYIYPGATLHIGYNKDPLQKHRKDSMDTIHAVVFKGPGQPLQRELITQHREAVTVKENDFSAASINARYDASEIKAGRFFEFLTHLDTPAHTKFLQIRSPLEAYKRRELYGRSFQPWDEPIKSILKPTIEAISAKTPVIAMTFTGALGYLASTGPVRKIATIGGAAVGGILSSSRVISETITKNTYIPAYRQKERDLEEYFDKLKYIKYKGLYEKAKQAAIKYEHIDVDQFSEDVASGGGRNKRAQAYLKHAKHIAKLYPESEEMMLRNKKLTEMLDYSASDRKIENLGPFALQALYYKLQYESTLYGADPKGEYVKIVRALPKRDREFFPEFIKASPEEREEILRLVPKNQRRFYQAKWGLKEDEEIRLNEYFKGHYLPGPDWTGWKADISLDDIKLKVLRNEGINIVDHGFWDEDIPYAEKAPGLDPHQKTFGNIEAKLYKVLTGAGLHNVDIKITHGPAKEAYTNNVNVCIENDVSQEFINSLNNNQYKLGSALVN